MPSYSSGITRPIHPSSAIFFQSSGEYPFSLFSISLTRVFGHSVARKSRTIFLNISCASVNLRSMIPPIETPLFHSGQAQSIPGYDVPLYFVCAHRDYGYKTLLESFLPSSIYWSPSGAFDLAKWTCKVSGDKSKALAQLAIEYFGC